MKEILTHLTFTFDESRISELEINDRLDAIIEAEFTDVADVHTRWISNLADAPLFGAATRQRKRTPNR